MSVPWMLLRLEIETRMHHARADEDRLAGLDVQTIGDYRAFLARVYGFEAAVEDVVWRVRGVDPQLLRGRERAQYLVDDLAALAIDDRRLPRAGSINVRSVAQALGWLFVIERNTLLAGLVKRHLQHQLGKSIACAYLGSVKEQPGTRLRALGEAIGRHTKVCTPRSIVAAANEAFRAQAHWYETHRHVIATPVESTTDAA